MPSSDQDFEQLKQNVEQTREIVERNNEMIKSIERSLFWQRVSSILYWIIIIGIAIGAFYFLQPYVDRLFDTYKEIMEGLNSIPTLSQ